MKIILLFVPGGAKDDGVCIISRLGPKVSLNSLRVLGCWLKETQSSVVYKGQRRGDIAVH